MRADFTEGAGYPPRLQRDGKLELTTAPWSQTTATGIPEGFRELMPGRVAPRGVEASTEPILIFVCMLTGGKRSPF